MKILTVSDINTGLELLGFAEKISTLIPQVKTETLIIGQYTEEQAKEYIKRGAEKIYIAKEADIKDPETTTTAIIETYNQTKPDIIAIRSTKNTKDAAARTAQQLGIGTISDIARIETKNGKLIFIRIILSGKATAYHEATTPTIVLIPPGKYEPPKPTEKTGEIINITTKTEKKTKTIKIEEKKKAAVKLEEAELIISVGRGYKTKEDLKIAFQLAETIGAQIGCSRPIAADLRWLTEEAWVGLSGHKVRPKMYMATGISGQMQHIAGIMDAGIVVAINKDPNAPIFQYADYGVVGDLYKIVPLLTKRLSEILK
ncbi:MAG: electron transfer flavoprotein subunit alpha/FixB family protein [Ignisphaera sp.]